MRRGCVITIITLSVIALVVSVLFYIFVWPETKKIGTSSFAFVIEDALEQYKNDQQDYPQATGNAEILKALYGDNPRKKQYLDSMESMIRDGQFTDFWKRPMRFEFPAGEKAVVFSAGPDGVFGNEDDITSQLAKDKWEKATSK